MTAARTPCWIPSRKLYPVVMNAGGPLKGRHFAAQHCDVAFVLFGPADLAGAKAHIATQRRPAREAYGRDIQIWAVSSVVQRESEGEAREFYDDYVHEKGDWVAINNLVETMDFNAKTRPPETMPSR